MQCADGGAYARSLGSDAVLAHLYLHRRFIARMRPAESNGLVGESGDLRRGAYYMTWGLVSIWLGRRRPVAVTPTSDFHIFHHELWPRATRRRTTHYFAARILVSAAISDRVLTLENTLPGSTRDDRLFNSAKASFRDQTSSSTSPRPKLRPFSSSVIAPTT